MGASALSTLVVHGFITARELPLRLGSYHFQPSAVR